MNSAKRRAIILHLLQATFYLGIVLFALYQFKRHTLPQPIYFTTAENDLKAGNETAARKEFDDALRKRPTDPEAYVSVLQSCSSQHKSALEIEYAQRAIDALKQQPAGVRAIFYNVESQVYIEMDRPPHQQRAIEAAKQALDLLPDSEIMQNQYGYLLADNALTRGPDVDKALIVLKKALDEIKTGKGSDSADQLGPIFVAETEDSYGWALYKNEDYPDALTVLTQALGDYPEALDDYPKNAPGDVLKASYYHLGMIYSKLGRKDQAANAFNSAIAYDAKYEDALTAMAALSPAKQIGVRPTSPVPPSPSSASSPTPIGSTQSIQNKKN